MSNTAPRKPGEASPVVQLAILVGIFILTLNAGFYFLSDAYFDDRVKRFGLQELAGLAGARRDFAIFTLAVGCAAVLAAMSPRTVAHGVAALAGLGALLAVPFAFAIGLVLMFTLLCVAGSFALLIWYSQKRSRAAWSVLAALCAVCAVVTLFGAPKIRGLVGVGLWLALIVPGLLGAATAALYRIRDQYGAAS